MLEISKCEQKGDQRILGDYIIYNHIHHYIYMPNLNLKNEAKVEERKSVMVKWASLHPTMPCQMVDKI